MFVPLRLRTHFSISNILYRSVSFPYAFMPTTDDGFVDKPKDVARFGPKILSERKGCDWLSICLFEQRTFYSVHFQNDNIVFMYKNYHHLRNLNPAKPFISFCFEQVVSSSHSGTTLL
jgi:hypothetical protein